MKKNVLCIACLLCIACTKQYYDERIADCHNYPYPINIDIDIGTNAVLIADGQFKVNDCDTVNLHRLNREMEIILRKRIAEKYYASIVREGNELSPKSYHYGDSLFYPLGSFFLYGKLDLQPDVKSLILLEYHRDIVLKDIKELWLINIKDNKLCSIALLDRNFLHSEDYCYIYVCLENKVFTVTRVCFEYYFITNIGQREWNRYESKVFARFRVNEAGHIEFVK